MRQRTEQLLAGNQELETFSYSVSHDLRTPLSTIDGFSALLGREMMAGATSARCKHYLGRIRAGVVQISELIDTLLKLSQVSRTCLCWDRLDLSAMAETVLSVYRECEPERVTQLDFQQGLIAQGDPRLIQQVLDNLLGNAWKFSSQQPKTRIALKRIITRHGGRSGPSRRQARAPRFISRWARRRINFAQGDVNRQGARLRHNGPPPHAPLTPNPGIARVHRIRAQLPGVLHLFPCTCPTKVATLLIARNTHP